MCVWGAQWRMGAGRLALFFATPPPHTHTHTHTHTHAHAHARNAPALPCGQSSASALVGGSLDRNDPNYDSEEERAIVLQARWGWLWVWFGGLAARLCGVTLQALAGWAGSDLCLDSGPGMGGPPRRSRRPATRLTSPPSLPPLHPKTYPTPLRLSPPRPRASARRWWPTSARWRRCAQSTSAAGTWR